MLPGRRPDRPSLPAAGRNTVFTPSAIHQFHGGSSAGDAITNGLLYTQQLLRTLGYASEIYCEDVAPELAGRIHPAAAFPDSEDVVLLLHFSWAIRYFEWLNTLKCRKALLFHNITPPEFFDEGQEFERVSLLSRQQLAGLRHLVSASLTNSHYSARDLIALGFAEPEVLPLLFDPAGWLAAPHDETTARRLAADPSLKILFVGRIVANKRQEDLLHVVRCLKQAGTRRPLLILPGGVGAGPAYGESLVSLAADLDVADCVHFAGKVSDAELRAFYRGADVFLSLSDHEGFCVPLVEAMAFDLPVVALASSAIPETVGQGGLLLDNGDPGIVAALLTVLADEPELRRRLVLAGRQNLERFDRGLTLHRLASFLRNRLGVEVAVPEVPVASASSFQCRIEGPFDSSYSLASVNRSLARALTRQGVVVGLHSTEGPGDYAPDPAFLEAEADIKQLWKANQATARPHVTLRNLYPPRVSQMPGATRVLGNWGWEESGLPADWVAQFNRELNLITTVSRYVARVLVDNGVKVPIAVVGNGAEHFRDRSPRQTARTGDSFRFLHVSSGFPRKGIDVLFEAWGKAFNCEDAVTLVVKTFPNIHNATTASLERLRLTHPNHAPVELIEEDVDDDTLVKLYGACDALVAPSRGEGFGLPLAEAMSNEVPVITTRHGGALDFCSDRTAWLVDFEYRYSESHLGAFNSVWAEPKVDDLVRALREVRDCTREERAAKTSSARKLIDEVFTWDKVARRTRTAIARLDERPATERLPKVALISTWNMRCGIASYARHQVAAFPHGSVRVFAHHCEERLRDDELSVLRCWEQGWGDDLERLYQAVHRYDPDIAVIQFNFGFFDIEAFGRLLDRLTDRGIACYVVLHSTMDVNKPERSISLRQIRPALLRVTRLLVHGAADLNRLKAMGLDANAAITPHGVVAPTIDCGAAVRSHLGLMTKRVIGCFGYMLPDKGFSTLLRAFVQLCGRHEDLHLLLVTSLFPAPVSQEELARCQHLLDEHPEAAKHVTLITDHLPEDEVHRLLQAMDLLVFPYQQTQESSSGAVRFAVAAQKPVACTPLPIFDDVADVVHRLPGRSSEELERGIEALLGDPQRLACHQARQTGWLREHDWRAVSARFWNMLRAPEILDLVAMDSKLTQ